MTLFKEIISGRFTNITILLVSAFITVITAFFTSQNYLLLSSNNFTELFSYINSNRYIATFSSFALIITASWMIYKLNDIYTFSQIRSNFPFWFLNLFYLSNPDINYLSQGTITIISLYGILFFIFKS